MPSVPTPDTSDIGFVCDVFQTTIHVYTKAYKVIELPYLPVVAPELGDWLEIYSKESYVPAAIMDLPFFKVSSEDGEIFVQLLITGPHHGLPKAVADKYKGLVWSPHLQLIRDPNCVYNRYFKRGEVGEVVVKYAPSSDGKFFEVIRAVKWLDGEPDETKKRYLKMAPWLMETLTDRAPVYDLVPKDMCSTNLKKVATEDCATGICIHHDFRNPCYLATNTGSNPKVAVMWSPMTGLSRWNIHVREAFEAPEKVDERPDQDRADTAIVEDYTDTACSKDPLLQLGEWFTYSFNDQRTGGVKKKQRKEKRAEVGEEAWRHREEKEITFNQASVTNVVPINPVKPTRRIVYETKGKNGEKLTEHNIEIECTFQFKHSFLEDEANRSVKDWATRERGLRVDAHFNDFDLGKIEIYPQVARSIIEKIENFQDNLKESNPEEFKIRQKDMIIVRGDVSRLPRFYINSKSFPKNGLFYLKRIYTICYQRDGKVIYQNPEEKNDMEVLKDLATIQVKF
uniref:DUF1618 domain-containing protein n=1 Tax=Caenorhabditis tropicalis TaxID=1561998 RepID=A0A1I7TBT2_9PELO